MRRDVQNPVRPLEQPVDDVDRALVASDRLDRQVAERIGPELRRHQREHLFARQSLLDELRREVRPARCAR